MYAKNVIAASALLSLVAAVPMAKRDVVWVTEIKEDVVTVPVTQTVWVNPTSSHYGHHAHSTVTSHVQSTVTASAAPVETSSSAESTSSYVAPTTSSTSVYVAPTTSSTSVYVAPTTSSTSVYVAPTTSSTSIYVAPTTSSTSVWVASTTSSTLVAVASTSATATTTSTDDASSASSASGATYTGDITYYETGEGSCGWTNTDSDAIVALPHVMMNNPANPNNNPLCGTYITISYAGSTHQAKIVDTCMGCDNAAIDLSPTLFTAVAPDGNGRVHDVEWWFTT
ncbi:hypothetical protein LTR36_005192 [Oleoguttula mirabilis]|uniref:RlpA-like protein double-psi beta-barrel domain-containing protein n=1 Tax=Oleoguttula mirabilis TaxID=1507867 RepID=A0AAV9JW98_9PEZI|nr:hypothetical protein LTR36_005192 [Oleoguttula mirabilis]